MESGKVGNTTRNNHRRFLSSLFGELVQKEIIPTNFIVNIKKLEERSKKNKPFDTQQLDDILNYTKENDPYLIITLGLCGTLFYVLLKLSV